MRVERWDVTAGLLTLVLITALPAAGQLPPSGLGPGDHYRVLFVTSSTTNGAIGDLAGADAFVDQAAHAAPHGCGG